MKKTSIAALFFCLFTLSAQAEENSLPKETSSVVQESPKTILEAICNDDPETLKKLISEGQSVLGCDRFGLSYLHMAAARGNSAIMQILLEAGTPVDQQCGKRQSTPAHSAVRFNQLGALQTLHQHKANLSLKDSEGKTPFDVAIENGLQDISDFILGVEQKI